MAPEYDDDKEDIIDDYDDHAWDEEDLEDWEDLEWDDEDFDDDDDEKDEDYIEDFEE